MENPVIFTLDATLRVHIDVKFSQKFLHTSLALWTDNQTLVMNKVTEFTCSKRLLDKRQPRLTMLFPEVPIYSITLSAVCYLIYYTECLIFIVFYR